MRLRERLEDRRLARRYRKGPGRAPTAEEVQRVRAALHERGIQPRPLFTKPKPAPSANPERINNGCMIYRQAGQ